MADIKNDNQLLKGGESPKPAATEPIVPVLVGGGGSLVDKAKEFHEKAMFHGSPMDKK